MICALSLAIAAPALAQTPVPVNPDETPPDAGDGPKPTPVNPDELPPDQRPPDSKPPDQKPPDQKPPDNQQKPPDGKPPGQTDQKPPTKPPVVLPPPRELPKSKTPDVILKSGPDIQIDESASQTPLVGSKEIKDIKVEENEKTDADTVIYISGLEKGDQFSAEDAKLAKDKLISCGLFKSVTVYWSDYQDGLRIHLMVKDKHSWIIAPAFYNQPTNVGGGVGFGENNLFGQNQKLLLYGQVATGDTFFIGAWVIPAIANTRWYAQFDTYLKSARNIEYATPTAYLDITDVGLAGSNPKAVRESRIHYLNGGMKLGIELFRGLKIDGRLRAAKVSYPRGDLKVSDGAMLGVDVMEDPANPGKPLPPGGEGWDVSNEITMQLDRRANYYGIQSGYKVGASLEYSLKGLGSDFDYWLAGVSIYKAKKILDRHNLVGKFFTGYGHNLPFQQEYLTGGTSMRGWLNNQFRGNLKVSGTAEYSLPILPTIYGLSVRGLVFWDSAYTVFTKTDPMGASRDYLPNAPDEKGLKPFKNSVGIGTRLYLRQIVLPLLGLDFGYGLEARDVQIYLAIGLTD